MPRQAPRERGRAPVPVLKPHLPVLDGLRGLAAVVVMISHLASATGLLQPLFGNGGGQIGVMLFFALSGFLMAHVYFERPFRPGNLWRYALARVSRVVPLFLIVVAVSFAATTTGIFRAYPVTLDNVLAHVSFRSGESVLWTIPVEMRFYALFPIFWLVYRCSSPAAAILAAVIAATYYLLPPMSMPVMRMGHYFLLGMVGWHVAGWLARRPSRIGDGGFVLSALALLLSLPPFFEAIFAREPRMWWEPQIALAVFAFLVFSVASPAAGRILGVKVMRGLGDISYALYLTHMLTFMNLKAFIDPLASPVLFSGVALPLAILQSVLIRRYVERPCQTFLLRFRDGPGRLFRPLEAR